MEREARIEFGDEEKERRRSTSSNELVREREQLTFFSFFSFIGALFFSFNSLIFLSVCCFSSLVVLSAF